MCSTALVVPPRFIAIAALPAVLALALYSCHDETPTEPASNIGPEGGTLSFVEGAVTLVIPAGALSEPVTILAGPAGVYPDSPTVLNGTVYAFAPRNLRFNQPVELSIKYDPADVPFEVTEPELEIYRVVGDDWRAVGGSRVETGDSTVTCPIDGFSSFGILGLSPNQSLSAQLVTPDTMVWTGDSVRYEAEVEYRGGLGPPRSAVWSVSDTSVARVITLSDGTGSVTGRSNGKTYVLATINDRFVDSAQVTVAEHMKTRWRVKAGSTPIPGPNVDALNRVVVQDGDFTLITPDGQSRRIPSFPRCWSDMGGSVLPDGTVYSPCGQVGWERHCGGARSSIAVGDDGWITCVVTGAYLLRVLNTGALDWTAPLGPPSLDQRQAPAISHSGDIYAVWGEDNGGPHWLARYTSEGDEVWKSPTSQWAKRTTPALFEDRVILTLLRNIVASYDTAGNLLWERSLGTGGTGGTRSPAIIDSEGNIYVQSNVGLASYDRDGNQRWFADSLSHRGWYNSSGAPALLTGGKMAVVVSGQYPAPDRLCLVNMSDGSRDDCFSANGTIYTSPAVGPDGTIYFDDPVDYLVALWNRYYLPLTEGWPQDGGNMGRTRRQQ